MNKINDDVLNPNNINGISEKSFNKLNDEQKNIILTGHNDTNAKEKEGGTLGKFLGTNTKNASIHIAFIISIVLVGDCGIDLLHSFCPKAHVNMDMWERIIPVITLALGYIFGKGENNQS